MRLFEHRNTRVWVVSNKNEIMTVRLEAKFELSSHFPLFSKPVPRWLGRWLSFAGESVRPVALLVAARRSSA